MTKEIDETIERIDKDLRLAILPGQLEYLRFQLTSLLQKQLDGVAKHIIKNELPMHKRVNGTGTAACERILDYLSHQRELLTKKDI